MDDEEIKEFTKNWHEKIRNGELVQCKECWIHCLLKADDLGKFKVVNGECRPQEELNKEGK